MSAEEFLKVQRQIDDVQPRKRKAPKGWEPGVDTAAGVVTVQGGETPPSDWSTVLRELSLDPEHWQVDESQPVQIRTWDAPGGERLFYYKATVKPAAQNRVSEDLDTLIRVAQRRRGKSPQKRTESASRSLVVCAADWQAGKGDHGGVEALLDRLWALHAAVPARVKELKKIGRPIDTLTVVGMGDMVEGCGNNHYAMQDFSLELDRRQQIRLVRRMLTEMLTEWAKLAPNVVVGCVPGNHGENRRNGKAFTRFSDNDDVAVFEQVQEILERAEGYDHVKWAIPEEDMSITLDCSGTIVTFLHGHQATGAGLPLQKVKRWWEGKMAALAPPGEASVAVYGHWHHAQLLQNGPRTIMGCPSNDGGSVWFEQQGGPTTACGTLTFTVDKDGWDDLRIL